ncbi:MAG: Uncharacterised protein [Owenweeksia sp. TMED14]|nr:MAG: Uncharacterised protein [Owenweeksia sp. TMED14]
MKNSYCQYYFILLFSVFAIIGCQNVSGVSDIISENLESGHFKFDLDTAQFADERFYSVNYQLVSIKSGSYKLVFELQQNNHSSVDSIIEFMSKGDTLNGVLYFDAAHLSLGPGELKGSFSYNSIED